MRFTVDVGELTVVLELDTEPAAVDLTRDGLGDRCLDAAVEGMLASHRARASAAAAILSAGARMFGDFSCILGVGRENDNRRTDRSTVLFLRGDLS
jgi:hypothetical protein